MIPFQENSRTDGRMDRRTKKRKEVIHEMLKVIQDYVQNIFAVLF